MSQCQEDSREKELHIEIQSFYLKHDGNDLVKQPVWLKSNKELHYNFLHDLTSGEGEKGWHTFKPDDYLNGLISYSQN